jgi:hypothetical protein
MRRTYYKNNPGNGVKAQKTYSLVDVVAACNIAFHYNGNKIEKYDVTAVPEHTDSYDGSKVAAQPAVTSNKFYAQSILDRIEVITDADRAEAQEIISYIQGQVTLSILSNKKVSTFVLELAKAMEDEIVPQHKVGLLVYAPNVWFSGQKRDAINEQTNELLYTSQPLGAVDQKVTLNFTLIETRFIQQIGCYSAYGKDDAGNLVSFLTKHEHLCVSGKIIGKVKKAEADQWHNNAIVTSLNYVKLAAVAP